MHTLQIHLGQALYNLAYVGKSPVHVISNIAQAKKDDPEGDLVITDDFGQHLTLKPKDIIGQFLVDHEREQEILIQRKLQDYRTNIEIQQRMAGDTKIKTAHMLAQGAA